MAYEMKSPGHPTGMHYPKVLKRCQELGLDEKGFPIPRQDQEAGPDNESDDSDAR